MPNLERIGHDRVTAFAGLGGHAADYVGRRELVANRHLVERKHEMNNGVAVHGSDPLSNARRKRVSSLLADAVAAAEACDVLREEAALREASLEALRSDHALLQQSSGWRKLVGLKPENSLFDEMTRKFEDLAKSGKLRCSKAIGWVGTYWFYADRILAREEIPDVPGAWVYRTYLMDEDVRASVESSGSLTVSRRPTLTRMAAGAILPGSALIPGFALAKKETFDTRELYFILEHPEGGAAVLIDPAHGAAVRTVAAEINSRAAVLRRERESARELTSNRDERAAGVASAVELLKELVAFRDAGVLTEHEFSRQKAQLLGDSEGEDSPPAWRRRTDPLWHPS